MFGCLCLQAKAARPLVPSGNVGFDSFPHQEVNKAIACGFSFNILCVGETGIGKSTLMDSLFDLSFESRPSTHFEATVKLSAKTYELQDAGVRLKLTVVKTVGFGDQMNREDSHQAILDYINGRYEAYLHEELKIDRSLHDYIDSRIHACIYFITPSGHSLKSLDLVTLKKLHRKVNIIPVIAKADTMSKTDLLKFKQKILTELVSNGVQIYQFPEDDVLFSKTNAAMNRLMPFAVVGSTEKVLVGNKMVTARQYPWGVIQVENDKHCDLVKLREMLINVNMEDLRERTHACHYESYRRRRLQEMGFSDPELEGGSPSQQDELASKRQEFLEELRRSEVEMRESLLLRVREKDMELKQFERKLQERFEQIKEMQLKEKTKLDQHMKQLWEDMDSFSTEKAEFISLHNQSQNNNEANWNNNKGKSRTEKDRKRIRDERSGQNGCCRSS
ncbi:septin-11-like [Aplochiton taeniatus]